MNNGRLLAACCFTTVLLLLLLSLSAEKSTAAAAAVRGTGGERNDSGNDDDDAGGGRQRRRQQRADDDDRIVQRRRRLGFPDDDEDGSATVPVLIGYTALTARSRLEGFVGKGGTLRDADEANLALARVDAMRAQLNRSQVDELYSHETEYGILYVEPDDLLYPLSSEVVPYGVAVVQADDQDYPPPPSSPEFVRRSAACDDPNSFKVGVVDSGLDPTNPG